MKILVDAREGRRNITGIGKVVRQGIKYITQLDHKNEYIIIPRDFSLHVRRGRSIKVLNFVVHLFWKQIYIPFLAFYKRVDVILTLAPESYFLTHRPVVIMVHDMIFFKLPSSASGLWGVYWRWMVPPSIKKASFIIVNSESTRNDVLEITGVSPHKVRKLLIGVERSEKKYDSGKMISANPYFLFVGNLEPRRGVEDILDAFEIFLRRHGEYRLIVVGRLTRYGKLLAERKTANVDFLGYVQDDYLTCLYKNATAYVYPSCYEGFGITILEAMSHGCPVITTKISSLPEVAGKAALMVPVNDPVRLLRAMTEVVENVELRNRLIAFGYDNVKRFRWENFAKEVIRILNEEVNPCNK